MSRLSDRDRCRWNCYFEGKDLTKTKGKAIGAIPATDLSKLLTQFETSDFFHLRDRYEGVDDGCTEFGSDFPFEILSLRSGGKKKTVSHYFGCRGAGDALTVIESLGKMVDDLTNSKKWTVGT